MESYLNINKQHWNNKVDLHYQSEFYSVQQFIEGETSLNKIELDILGNIAGKSILHLQCHFGQDSIALSRMGAKVTGVDFSDKAINKAEKLNELCSTSVDFICSDIYDLPMHLNKKYDYVFTSYGTITWLPDLDKWAQVVKHFLNPNGKLILVEFHPFLWMYNSSFTSIDYSYFNTGPIEEVEEGSYTDRNAPLKQKFIGWNHALSEVATSLINNQFEISSIKEYDYSPYPIFGDMLKEKEKVYRLKKFENKLPMVYSLEAVLK